MGRSGVFTPIFVGEEAGLFKKYCLTDRKVFDAAYAAELKVLEPRFEIRHEAIQATLQEIAKTDPRAKQVKAEQLIDRRFLEEMAKDGTFERLGLAR